MAAASHPTGGHIHWRPLASLLDEKSLPAKDTCLPGFDSEFSGLEDFIIKITHRIWEQKNVGRCADYYSDPCPVHTLGGYSDSVDEVTQNTLAMISAFPDRSLIGDNVVWSDEGDGVFYSSHRIISTMTHLGSCEFGPATGRSAWVMTVADCVCRANRVEYEWLMRDNSFLALQLGLDPLELAHQWALRQPPDKFTSWWQEEFGRVSQTAPSQRFSWPAADEDLVQAGRSCANAWLDTLFNRKEFGAVETFYRPNARVIWPGGRHPIGLRGITGTLMQWLSQFVQTRATCDHVAVTAFDKDTFEVALRWTLAGRYAGKEPALQSCRNLPTLVLASTHLRVQAGKIIEEWTVFDEVSLYANLIRAQVSK